MKYVVKYQDPHKRTINLEFNCKVSNAKTRISLPSWRPGRYELGNFAKNIVRFEVLNPEGKRLLHNKVTKDSWEVFTKGEREIVIKYSVFTPEFNAGACWIDYWQLYVNGIHCFLYNEELLEEKCELELQIPDNFVTVIGLPLIKKNHYQANNYHDLVDSPFVCSAALKQFCLIIEDYKFNLWFQGANNIPEEKLKIDFEKFIREQLKLFGTFVTPEYHFIFQLTPYKHYHGVEHITSTVITLGPENQVFEKPLYNELLGISCHELFHCWNVKTIRPADMLPYRYQEENYSKLGYVAEGVTTYYGDYLLLRSGVFSWQEFSECFNQWLNGYYENDGRFNLSVADSSFDTWLDGYVPGVPGRKVSIYNEGALCAFILDILIRMHTKNKKSLDDVMRALNSQFGMLKKGYTAKDYRNIAEEVAGVELCNYFDDLINGIKDYTPYLVNCLKYLGLTIQKDSNPNLLEHYWGVKLVSNGNGYTVKSVKANSPADKAGIMIGAQLVSVNGMEITTMQYDLLRNINFNETAKVELNCFGYYRKFEICVLGNETYYPQHRLQFLTNFSKQQNENFLLWAGIQAPL